MAQRFGGKYSPDGSPDRDAKGAAARSAFQDARPAKSGARVNLLFLAPLPLAFSLFGGGATQLAVSMGALVLLLLAAWLTRAGLQAEEAYDARKIAKAPAIPRKIFGSVATGLGLALGSYLTMGLGAVVVGVIGAGLHSFAFGLDPLRSKGAEGVDQFQQDRVARVVDEAERHLTHLTPAVAPLNDRQVTARVEAFQTTAREMFRTVESDPRDLTGARKFMGVYLMGARDATIKFADLYARGRDASVRADYLALLDDLDRNFASKTQTLLLDDRSDMDIEIKVLRDRLDREGVRMDQ
ncbi:MAG: 5-bromo-4-chloroindolyl phosphate hydrolysis family protein [Pseudomonadota bacterium]